MRTKYPKAWREQAEIAGWKVYDNGGELYYQIEAPNGKLWGWEFYDRVEAWTRLYELNEELRIPRIKEQ